MNIDVEKQDLTPMNIILIFAFLMLTMAVSHGEEDKWIPIGDTKNGEILMVTLQETLTMRKIIGEWLPLQTFEVDGQSKYLWKIKSLTIKDEIMSLVVLVRNETLGKETDIQTSFYNGYPAIDLKTPWEYFDKEKNIYLLPQKINSEMPVTTRQIKLFRAGNLADLEKQLTITKAAVFWKWSEVTPTKF